MQVCIQLQEELHTESKISGKLIKIIEFSLLHCALRININK